MNFSQIFFIDIYDTMSLDHRFLILVSFFQGGREGAQKKRVLHHMNSWYMHVKPSLIKKKQWYSIDLQCI